MCNVIDGPCELAGIHPDNPYHNNPTLDYQVRGELIDLHSAVKRVSPEDLEYGFKVGSLRKNTSSKIIAICTAILSETKPA